MRRRWIKVRKIKVLGKLIKGLRFLYEVVKSEDCFGSWQIVLLEIAVQPCTWRPEIRYASRYRNPGACHYDDFTKLIVAQAVD